MKTLSSTCIRFIYRSSLIIALQMTIASVGSFFAGYYLGIYLHMDQTIIGGLWSVISAILITQATVKESLDAAWLRIIGSFIGAMLALVFISLLGYHWWAFAISIFFTVMACSLFNLHNAFRLACITIVIIMLIGAIEPTIKPWENCLARFIESLIGVSVALIIAIPLKPLRLYVRQAYEQS